MSVQEQIDDLRTQRAAEWLQLLREDGEEARAGFTRWIGESPLNLEEYLKLEALSRETQSVLRSAAFDRAALLKDLPPQIVPLRRPALAARRSPNTRPWIRITGIAAAVAIIALAALFTYDRGAWRTAGRAVFNLSPAQVVEKSVGRYAPVSPRPTSR